MGGVTIYIYCIYTLAYIYSISSCVLLCQDVSSYISVCCYKGFLPGQQELPRRTLAKKAIGGLVFPTKYKVLYWNRTKSTRIERHRRLRNSYFWWGYASFEAHVVFIKKFPDYRAALHFITQFFKFERAPKSASQKQQTSTLPEKAAGI